MSDVIVRMPPSPTGLLHLGTARAALFNWLFAKSQGGKIIFRWEDTDRERSKPEFETIILDGLKWLGMDFAAECEFYRQTENTAVHEAHLQKLWENGKVFPCFVTPEEIDAEREKARAEKRNFVFWSPFRDLPKAEAEARMKTDPFVWRLKTPKNEWINFKDVVRKKVSVNTDTLGDFAVARSDGSVLYMLANVVDDATQGVTHVIRGEDHVSNTPKQILIYKACGYNVPQFAHLPLVLDAKKRKLSKRNVEPGVAVLVSDFQKAGFVPEAVVNGLVFLGWHPKDTKQEIFSFAELEQVFALEKVNSAGSQYDFEKMLWFNAKWMKQLPIEKIQAYYEAFSGKKVALEVLDVARQKAKTMADFEETFAYLLADPGFEVERLVNERFGLTIEKSKEILAEIVAVLDGIAETDFNAAVIKDKSVEKIAELGLKNGEFLTPFRAALSNRDASAGPFDIAAAIGKSATLSRLNRAILA
ncbi:glutamate--tRNA ligase [bacterium DOLZORAL124_38_8]|nr:MAG: glutamate--tRNA ligase [bacterium DOLZORAL124_38_8]